MSPQQSQQHQQPVSPTRAALMVVAICGCLATLLALLSVALDRWFSVTEPRKTASTSDSSSALVGVTAGLYSVCFNKASCKHSINALHALQDPACDSSERKDAVSALAIASLVLISLGSLASLLAGVFSLHLAGFGAQSAKEIEARLGAIRVDSDDDEDEIPQQQHSQRDRLNSSITHNNTASVAVHQHSPSPQRRPVKWHKNKPVVFYSEQRAGHSNNFDNDNMTCCGTVDRATCTLTLALFILPLLIFAAFVFAVSLILWAVLESSIVNCSWNVGLCETITSRVNIFPQQQSQHSATAASYAIAFQCGYSSSFALVGAAVGLNLLSILLMIIIRCDCSNLRQQRAEQYAVTDDEETAAAPHDGTTRGVNDNRLENSFTARSLNNTSTFRPPPPRGRSNSKHSNIPQQRAAVNNSNNVVAAADHFSDAEGDDDAQMAMDAPRAAAASSSSMSGSGTVRALLPPSAIAENNNNATTLSSRQPVLRISTHAQLLAADHFALQQSALSNHARLLGSYVVAARIVETERLHRENIAAVEAELRSEWVMAVVPNDNASNNAKKTTTTIVTPMTLPQRHWQHPSQQRRQQQHPNSTHDDDGGGERFAREKPALRVVNVDKDVDRLVEFFFPERASMAALVLQDRKTAAAAAAAATATGDNNNEQQATRATTATAPQLWIPKVKIPPPIAMKPQRLPPPAPTSGQQQPQQQQQQHRHVRSNSNLSSINWATPRMPGEELLARSNSGAAFRQQQRAGITAPEPDEITASSITAQNPQQVQPMHGRSLTDDGGVLLSDRVDDDEQDDSNKNSKVENQPSSANRSRKRPMDATPKVPRLTAPAPSPPPATTAVPAVKKTNGSKNNTPILAPAASPPPPTTKPLSAIAQLRQVIAASEAAAHISGDGDDQFHRDPRHDDDNESTLTDTSTAQGNDVAGPIDLSQQQDPEQLEQEDKEQVAAAAQQHDKHRVPTLLTLNAPPPRFGLNNGTAHNNSNSPSPPSSRFARSTSAPSGSSAAAAIARPFTPSSVPIQPAPTLERFRQQSEQMIQRAARSGSRSSTPNHQQQPTGKETNDADDEGVVVAVGPADAYTASPVSPIPVQSQREDENNNNNTVSNSNMNAHRVATANSRAHIDPSREEAFRARNGGVERPQKQQVPQQQQPVQQQQQPRSAPSSRSNSRPRSFQDYWSSAAVRQRLAGQIQAQQQQQQQQAVACGNDDDDDAPVQSNPTTPAKPLFRESRQVSAAPTPQQQQQQRAQQANVSQRFSNNTADNATSPSTSPGGKARPKRY